METRVARFAVDTTLARLAVETKLAKLAVDTTLARFAVDTKLARFAVDTKLARFAVETTEPQTIVETYPAVPRPITVEPTCVAKYEVLTRVAKLAVETKLAKLAVETRPAKLAVETNPPIEGIVEIYPAVPRPITVEVSCVARYGVLTKLVRPKIDDTVSELILAVVRILPPIVYQVPAFPAYRVVIPQAALIARVVVPSSKASPVCVEIVTVEKLVAPYTSFRVKIRYGMLVVVGNVIAPVFSRASIIPTSVNVLKVCPDI